MKCHIPVDISKIKIKTKHFLGIKDKPSGHGVAAEPCDEKGFFQRFLLSMESISLWALPLE